MYAWVCVYVEPLRSACHHSPVLGFQMHAPVPVFYLDDGDLNLGLLAYTAELFTHSAIPCPGPC